MSEARVGDEKLPVLLGRENFLKCNYYLFFNIFTDVSLGMFTCPNCSIFFVPTFAY